MLTITLNLVKIKKKELQDAAAELTKAEDAEKESKIQEHHKQILQYDNYVNSIISDFGK